jgi:hypothetical protein
LKVETLSAETQAIRGALRTLSDQDLQLLKPAAESEERGAEFEVRSAIEAAIGRYQAALAIEQRKFGIETKPGRVGRKATCA